MPWSNHRIGCHSSFHTFRRQELCGRWARKAYGMRVLVLYHALFSLIPRESIRKTSSFCIMAFKWFPTCIKYNTNGKTLFWPPLTEWIGCLLPNLSYDLMAAWTELEAIGRERKRDMWEALRRLWMCDLPPGDSEGWGGVSKDSAILFCPPIHAPASRGHRKSRANQGKHLACLGPYGTHLWKEWPLKGDKTDLY